MSENLTVSREVAQKLQEIKKTMETLLGKQLTIDQVLVTLIDVYTKGASIEPGRIDMLIDIWDKLQELEKRVSALEQRQAEPAEAQPKQEQPQRPQEKVASQPQRETRTPPVVAPKVVQPAQPAPERQTQDSFLKFLEDVVVYPLSKIRKPREQIDRLAKENLVSIMSVGGEELLVHMPSYQAFLKKLPIPIADKQKLSPRERRLLETLSQAGLVYEDATSGMIRSV